MIGTDRLAFMASLGFSRMEPRKVVATLKQLGYGGVEWTLAHFNPRTTSKQQRQELVQVTRDAGLEITEVVVQQDMVSLDENARRDRIDLVRECIEAAHDADVGILNVFSGPAPWNPEAPKLGSDISEGQAWDQAIEAYSELAELAGGAQVHLAVEAVFGMLVRDYYTLHQLLTAVDSPFLSVNFDPSHLVLYRNDPAWAIRQLRGTTKSPTRAICQWNSNRSSIIRPSSARTPRRPRNSRWSSARLFLRCRRAEAMVADCAGRIVLDAPAFCGYS